MPNRVVLNNIDHGELTVAIRHGAAFDDAVNQVPILPTELEEAQREFPILFHRRAGGIEAVALLGLDRDENLFLDGDRWSSRHIPLLQQRGPFSIGLSDGGEPMLHVDLEDPRVGSPDGAPLFLPHGGNGPYLEHVSQVLRLIHAGAETAQAMYGALDAAGLIQPIALEVTLDAETRYAITGHEVLSRERLAALSGTELEALHREGFLASAFLIAASLGNISGLIERKNARRRAA
ncbi:SapC family protein [Sphingomonas sp. IC-56]|uniref:SapC family protein n=1 Tax=Sphingomonas sp. IC-56 TaxID=2898529 RepID=UPI001E5BF2DB|nr:SapC family protein [Sphingomonas sp. IC-56]MCD2324369.1 SapC family protein [Sphingomonas sp. IC-56]